MENGTAAARRILTGAGNLLVLALLAWGDVAFASGWIGWIALASFAALAAREATTLLVQILGPRTQGTGSATRGLSQIVGIEAILVLAAAHPASPLRSQLPGIVLLLACGHGLHAARGIVGESPGGNGVGATKSGERDHAANVDAQAGARWRRAGGVAVAVAFVLSWVPGLLASLGAILLGPAGPAAGYAVVFATKASDVGGYLVGRRFGRTKIAPSVSPGKSVEGTIGGIALSTLVAIALRGFLGTGSPLSVLSSAGLGLALGVTGLLGDLTESLLKRAADVKDSGRGIPTTGGFLDMVDSLLIAAPVAYVWLHASGS